jgi:hypothetical protein
MSSRSNYTTMWCTHCGNDVDKVDPSTHSVTCWKCLQKRCLALWNPAMVPVRKSSGKPAGWHWMKEFVDKDGNVFHKGKEVPELKGTLKPTKVKPPKKRKKKVSHIHSWEADTTKLAKQYKEKKKLKRAIQKQKNFLDHKIDKGGGIDG